MNKQYLLHCLSGMNVLFSYLKVWKRWVGNNDNAGKHRQSLLVKSLMLRRTKKELSQFTSFNLPSKTIHTVEIELSKEERSAYIQLLQFSRFI